MTLTKDALISAVAKANGYPRNQAVELVDIILELIKFRLAAGEDIMISGFGKFCVNLTSPIFFADADISGYQRWLSSLLILWPQFFAAARAS